MAVRDILRLLQVKNIAQHNCENSNNNLPAISPLCCGIFTVFYNKDHDSCALHGYIIINLCLSNNMTIRAWHNA